MVEKKLIICSIFAIVIGIASIVPLAFFMTPANAQTTLYQPWFNLNVPYAYWAANLTDNSNGTVSYSLENSLAFNYTITPAALKEASEARIEYYQIQVYSNKGPVDNFTYYVEINSTGLTDPTSSFQFARENWFSSNTTSGMSISGPISNYGSHSLTSTSQRTMGLSPSTDPYLNSQLLPQISSITNAQTIYINVRRLGYVTFNETSTVATLADNAIIQHIELKKYRDGFLYNTIIPENQLPNTNLFAPVLIP